MVGRQPSTICEYFSGHLAHPDGQKAIYDAFRRLRPGYRGSLADFWGGLLTREAT